jgi:hypothetical protein
LLIGRQTKRNPAKGEAEEKVEVEDEDEVEVKFKFKVEKKSRKWQDAACVSVFGARCPVFV